MEHVNKKVKAPSQFVRMPDGTVKVVSVKPAPEPAVGTSKKSKRHLKIPKIRLPKRKSKPQKLQNTNTDPTPPKQINISLSVPKLEISKLIKKLPKPTRKQLYIVLPIIIILIGAGVFFINRPDKPAKPTTKVLGQEMIKLDFTPLLAPGKKLATDPEAKRKTGSFTDKIGAINIKVSEQILPADFKPDITTRMADFAKTNYYSKQVKSGDTTVYIGMSIKGAQSVVFTKNDVLVFIKAEKELDQNAIADYVASMK